MSKRKFKRGPYTIRKEGSREIRYAVPDWSDEELPYISYQGDKVFLDEFVTSGVDKWLRMLGIQAVRVDSYFSALGIKLDRDSEYATLYLIMV